MARGAKPKPTWLKLVAGMPGHRPLNLDEPLPDGDLSEPPEWFTPGQIAIWQTALKAAPIGLLKALDASILIVWCTACSLHADANEKIAHYGSVIKHPVTGTPMCSPFVQIAKQNAELMLRAAAEMGFSPSSRSKVKVDAGKRIGNRFSELKGLKELDE